MTSAAHMLVGYEPGNLTVQPPPPKKKNCQERVHFFRIGV